MESFGERLRHERETRNTTIEEIATATGIHRGFLEALETNDFQSLPGRAFGKFYLRAYAEILDFDPEPLIVHYDRERRREPPEAYERPPDEPTLRKVEASLAKWRAERLSRHGGREIVGTAEPEAAQDVEVAADQLAPELHGGRENVGTAEPEIAQDVEVAADQLAPELHGGRESVGTAEPGAAQDTELAHGGREIVGTAEPEIAQDVEVAAEQLAPVQVADVAATSQPSVDPPSGTHAQSVRVDSDYKSISGNEIRAARFRRPHILAATVGVAVLGVLFLLVRPSPSPTPTPPAPVVSAPATVAAPAPEPPPVVSPPKPKPVPVRTRPSSPPTSTTLSVSDFGLGRQEGSRIVPGGETYNEGDIVAFSTRVIGGHAGQSIRHVWLYRGRAVQSIRLRVGAADWRTHSTKTLWQQGAWTVEARDESGRVLAQASFTCERVRR